MHFTNKLKNYNLPEHSGESDIARRARDLVDGMGRPGQFTGDALDREMQRRRQSGHYAHSNHGALPTREDELPFGGQGSSVGAPKAEPEKPRPLDFDDHREALIAKLKKEMRSSDYIEAALEVHDQTWKNNEKMAAEKAGRAAAQEHHEATQSWHEENRHDHSNEYPVDRLIREDRERAADAWRTPASADDTREDSDGEPGESPVDRARRENEERGRNAWRTPR
ncbi:MAG: hypothetical protein WDO69_05600 [Pseudomonadota bacterium]